MSYKLNKWQTKWLEALESGEYAQTSDYLCDGNGFCCLGVACEVLGLEAEKVGDGVRKVWRYGHSTIKAHREVVRKMRLRDNSGTLLGSYTSLAGLNDNGKTFAEIAAFIRANPERVFK